MLKLDSWTVLFQIVNFLVLTAVLYFVLFKPVLRHLRAQAKEKEHAERELARNQHEIAAARRELQERLASAQDEADLIVANAHEQAESLRRSLLEAVEQEAERILAEAHADAGRSQEQLMADFQDDLVHTVTMVSSQLIGRIAPQEIHDTMVQQLNDRIWEMGRSEMQQVEEFRRALGTRVPSAYVTTARPLTTEQHALLARTFAALADRQVNIDIQVDPGLAVGLRVRLGDIIVDNSVAGQMEALQDDVTAALKAQGPLQETHTE